MKKILPIILFVFILSCVNKNSKNIDKPLAKVNDKILYESETKGLISRNISKVDSIAIVKNYIQDWIKKQLLLQKAELNLSEDSKDIERQINDYRSSLLIFRYQQQLIQQKLDTVITDQEIEDYYNQYSGNFILNHNIVKVLYIKIYKDAPEIDKVKRWYKSNNTDDLSRLEDYCYQYATKFDNFNDEWIPFNNILTEVPISIDDQERFLKYNKYIEIQDDVFNYLIKINDFSLKSTIQPLAYAKTKIKNIILNKRKFTFIDELENNVYKDALNHNEFIIY